MRCRVARYDHQRRRAAVAGARLAAAAQEAKEGLRTAGRRRGDRGIAAVVTAALAQWARILKRGACAGAALALSDREGGHQCRMPVHDGAMGDLEGGESAASMGGGDCRGERRTN